MIAPSESVRVVHHPYPIEGREPPGDGVRFGFGAEEIECIRSSDAPSGSGSRVLCEGALERLFLVRQKGRLFENLAPPEVRTLFGRGRFLIVEMSRAQAEALEAWRCPSFEIEPVRSSATLFDLPVGTEHRFASQTSDEHELAAQLSEASYATLLDEITSHLTRHSLSFEYDVAAIRALHHFEDMGYGADLVPFRIGPDRCYNVVARAPSRDARGSAAPLVIVAAHLDSVNIEGSVEAPAPGADDNASGAAAVLELARVFRRQEMGAQLRFVLFGGAEQGRCGSHAYVESLSERDRGRLCGVIDLDTIGRGGDPPTVLLEGGSGAEPLLALFARAARSHTRLHVRRSLRPFGSDHVPFLDAGFPAVLVSEGGDLGNEQIHTVDDTIEGVDTSFAIEVLRMCTAALLVLGREALLARPAPDERAV